MILYVYQLSKLLLQIGFCPETIMSDAIQKFDNEQDKKLSKIKKSILYRYSEYFVFLILIGLG